MSLITLYDIISKKTSLLKSICSITLGFQRAIYVSKFFLLLGYFGAFGITAHELKIHLEAHLE